MNQQNVRNNESGNEAIVIGLESLVAIRRQSVESRERAFEVASASLVVHELKRNLHNHYYFLLPISST